MPPRPEPLEDPWDEPPPEEDPYVPRQMDAPPAPRQPPRSVAPMPPGAAAAAPDVPAASPGGAEVTTLRPSRYSKIAAVPPAAKEPTPAEEASVYSDEDDTVGEGYESAAELLTNVLGAELILEEAQDGQPA